MNHNDLILASSNWNDFFERVSVLENTKEKGDVFERFIKLYLMNGSRNRLLFKEVWKFDLDFKIDLFFELKDPRQFALY